ncbi:MAG: NADH-quinone oxidoreductase subunit N [Anaerolineae bacterium]|nr:NADH-quinone oxidoreductase subunit N [Anaerolineae bacterium]MCZ7552781.1 NADH-quinone oxidoreductase subunit N [Anaerolineales bacterium]
MLLNIEQFLPILPQILLLILGLVVLALQMILPKSQHRNLGWVTAVGMGLVILFSLPARPGTETRLAWGGMISYDWLSFTFQMLFIFAAGITALLAMDLEELGARGEFYVLMIASTIGMSFMASAADLVMLYLSIETVSIPLYVLAGFFVFDNKSTEAGFKYLLFGALTSAIMLFGFTFLYGMSGTTNLAHIVVLILRNPTQGLLPAYIGSLILILVGFGFKISAVPFHFWAPDVYEGAPTPVAGFLSTASKAAGFAVLVRVLLMVFPAEIWSPVLAALSVATMTLGNLVALTQHNIKRMLAYSSIAHAGYALIGVASVSALGLTSVVYYLLAYLITNLAAFGIVSAVGKVTRSDELTAYYGLSRRSPYLALALLVALLSLAGMPPLAGFIAKVLVFMAAVEAGLIWLAVMGVLNSIVGLYYYLTVLKYVYLYRSEGAEDPLQFSRPFTVAIVVLIVSILLVGTLFGPWFTWANTAAAALF